MMVRKLKAYFTFYRSFFFVSFLITVICLFILIKSEFKLMPALFWLKSTTLAIIYYVTHINKQREFFYYQNLGISRIFLWVSTLGTDMFLFLLLSYLLYLNA